MGDSVGVAKGAVEISEDHKELLASVKKSFGDPTYADLTIDCGGYTWRVHRNIVCGQCPFFDKACSPSNGFKESSSQVITLEEDDPRAVHMLHFFYNGDYCGKPEESMVPRGSDVMTSVLVHTIVDKVRVGFIMRLPEGYANRGVPGRYRISTLTRLAIAEFAKHAERDWNKPAFASAVEEMYTAGGDEKEEMRKKAISVAAQHAKTLLNDASCSDFRMVAESIPKLAVDLATQVINVEAGKSSMTRCQCPGCKKEVIMSDALFENVFFIHCPLCGRGSNKLAWISRFID